VTVAPGSGPFEVTVTVDDVTNEQGLGGYTLVMEYDPSVVEARAINDTGYIGITENAAFCPSSAIENDEGRLAHFCFTVPLLQNPGPRPEEPQAMVRVTLEPVGEGQTTLDIRETTIIDPDGNTIESTTRNARVVVGEPGAPSPTPLVEEDGDGGGTNAGLIAGIAVGVAAVVAGVGTFAWWWRARGAS
jgi:hypothetical protein